VKKVLIKQAVSGVNAGSSPSFGHMQAANQVTLCALLRLSLTPYAILRSPSSGFTGTFGLLCGWSMWNRQHILQ
jgi:hypothetical protein